jgi:hypothetical protein
VHEDAPDVWDVAIFRIPLQMSKNRTVKIDDPMTFGYGIDATDSAATMNSKWAVATDMAPRTPNIMQ